MADEAERVGCSGLATQEFVQRNDLGFKRRPAVRLAAAELEAGRGKH